MDELIYNTSISNIYKSTASIDGGYIIATKNKLIKYNANNEILFILDITTEFMC